MKKRILIISAAIVLLVCGYEARLMFTRSDFTVSAYIRMKDRDAYTDEYLTAWVKAADDAEWAPGNSADFRPARFSNGVLRMRLGHGPFTLRGHIARQDILKACPGTFFYADWPFCISLYNTSSGRVLHTCLDIRFDQETGKAAADLYVYYDGHARAMTDHWEGLIGETVSVSLEV